MNTKELIEAWPFEHDDDRQILLGAISTRGQMKGYLLQNAPSESKRPKDWTAWQVLVSSLAPMRVSIWSLMFTQGDFTELEKRTQTDLFRVALNLVEPTMRWNLDMNSKEPDPVVIDNLIMLESKRLTTEEI